MKIRFFGTIPIYELMNERLRNGEEGVFYVTVTHFLTKELYLSALKIVSSQNYVSILFISDDVTATTKELADSMKMSGIGIFQIMSDEEIANVLSKEIA
jgi:hypothetical protein